ncbi:hypothetical protein pb186bvf_012452 [Paramecium bursaria]
MIQKVQNARLQSASRSQKRALETINLQYNSNQPLTYKQRTTSPTSKIQPYNNVHIEHIINKTDHKWNHLENAQQKQLDIFFSPVYIKGEEWCYDNIKKKYVESQKQDEVKLEKKMQIKSNIHYQHIKMQEKNKEIYQKLKLTQKKSERPTTSTTKAPLFVRLSVPKQQYFPEATYDLPEYRGLALQNFTHIDEYKNPELLNYFKATKLVPKSVYAKGPVKQFPSEPKKIETLQRTIDLDTLKMEQQFNDDALGEIELFELNLQSVQTGNYSQVKHKENQMLESINGFRELREIKKQSNYHHLLGRQISLQQIKQN